MLPAPRYAFASHCVSLGNCSVKHASTPATLGDAILVPLYFIILKLAFLESFAPPPLSCTEDTTFDPGA